MFTIVCDTCGAEFTGHNEHEAEVLWNSHECKSEYEKASGRDNYDLPLDLLRRIALGEITDAEAWAIVDANRSVERDAPDLGHRLHA